MLAFTFSDIWPWKLPLLVFEDVRIKVCKNKQARPGDSIIAICVILEKAWQTYITLHMDQQTNGQTIGQANRQTHLWRCDYASKNKKRNRLIVRLLLVCNDGNKIEYRSSNITQKSTKHRICSLCYWCTFVGLIKLVQSKYPKTYKTVICSVLLPCIKWIVLKIQWILNST